MTTNEDTQAAINASLQQGILDTIQTKIQEEVTKIAAKFALPLESTKEACRELCSRHITINTTLAGLLDDDLELRQEFFLILAQQRTARKKL